MEYNVVMETTVDAESPLEAAQITQQWLQEIGSNWTYYVQGEDGDVFSIDLAEEDAESVVCKVDNYIPLIN